MAARGDVDRFKVTFDMIEVCFRTRTKPLMEYYIPVKIHTLHLLCGGIPPQ